MYDYKRINTFLQQHTGKVDPTKEDSAYIFTIHFEFSTYREGNVKEMSMNCLVIIKES